MVEKRYNIKENEARAFLRMVKGSTQKVNLVAASVRNLKVDKALAELTFSKKRVAIDVKKLLLSAISNAENNYHLDVDKLYVKEAYVGPSVVMKRFKCRARGRGAKILKHFSNVTMIVEERNNVAKPVRVKKNTETKKNTDKKEAK